MYFLLYTNSTSFLTRLIGTFTVISDFVIWAWHWEIISIVAHYSPLLVTILDQFSTAVVRNVILTIDCTLNLCNIASITKPFLFLGRHLFVIWASNVWFVSINPRTPFTDHTSLWWSVCSDGGGCSCGWWCCFHGCWFLCKY